MKVERFHVGPRLSEMAIHHGTVYLAGQVAEDTSQDMAGQTQQVLASIDRLLAEAGTDKTRILMAQVIISDMRHFGELNRVWESWVTAGHTPPRATIEAKLATPKHLVEIIVTAAQK
ncbi:MAG: RidA family protein [Burkholderiales bacterium]|nr:RidA family protein [Burkholderiales bacterium]